RNTNSPLRERLLGVLSAARRREAGEELGAMQAEADTILRDTLDCFEHGPIAEGTLTAFNIALEQFHNAVADRKALLAIQPQTPPRSNVQLRSSSVLYPGLTNVIGMLLLALRLQRRQPARGDVHHLVHTGVPL